MTEHCLHTLGHVDKDRTCARKIAGLGSHPAKAQTMENKSRNLLH